MEQAKQNLIKQIDMNTQENNKIIAEFMGYKNPSNAADIWYHYDTSWDWLMPVSQKIDKYLEDNMGKVGYFDDCLLSNDIDVRYQAVVEFINQYNK